VNERAVVADRGSVIEVNLVQQFRYRLRNCHVGRDDNDAPGKLSER
jgi:hypothetical protein